MATHVAILLLLSKQEVFDSDAGREIHSKPIAELNHWLTQHGWPEMAEPLTPEAKRHLLGAPMFILNLDGREVEAFAEFAREQEWRHPESLQILAKEAGAPRFRAV